MLIKVRDLKKEYQTGEVVAKVLQGLSFDIEKGEFIAIMGPSGSGKSTLMHILGFLDRPTSGLYEFEGQNINEFDDDELAYIRNKKIGFVFQSFNLLNRTNVLDIVKLPLVYSKISNKEKRAKEAIEAVGLTHRITHTPGQLSGGEQQRVAIARALVNDPAIIFADEPTGNLDSRAGLQIIKILQQLNNEGRTIILVTHEIYTAEHAKRKICLKDGQMVGCEVVIEQRIAEKEEGLLK